MEATLFSQIFCLMCKIKWRQNLVKLRSLGFLYKWNIFLEQIDWRPASCWVTWSKHTQRHLYFSKALPDYSKKKSVKSFVKPPFLIKLKLIKWKIWLKIPSILFSKRIISRFFFLFFNFRVGLYNYQIIFRKIANLANSIPATSATHIDSYRWRCTWISLNLVQPITAAHGAGPFT